MYSIFIFLVVVTVGYANVLPNDSPFWSTRILGGAPVPIEDFPYQVSLQAYGRHYCGGSILDENHIITTAHCVQHLEDFSASVRAGSNMSFTGGSEHNITWVKIHEDFASSRFEAPKNDIALAKVDPPFTIDQTRSPIPLYQAEEDIKDGQISVISGYGRTSEGGSPSKHLMAVEVPIVDREICGVIYEMNMYFRISQDFICAGPYEGGRDSCQGDSGGPIVVDGQLAGLSSFGFGCGRPGIPGVYTNVAYFYKWIMENIK